MSGCQLRVEESLFGRPPRLLQAGGFGACDAVGGHVRQYGSAPDLESRLQLLDGSLGVVARQLRPTGSGQRFEPLGVELTGMKRQDVPGWPSLQGRGVNGKSMAQRRDMHVQGVAGRRRWNRIPQSGDETVGRDQHSRVDGEHREQGPLQRTLDGSGRTVEETQLDRTEEPNLGERRRLSLIQSDPPDDRVERLERLLRSPGQGSARAR